MTITYNMPAEDYHLNPAIGSSRAKLVLDSMQLFKDDQDGLVPNKPSAAKTFGTGFHLRMLQPSLFAELISTGPINPKTSKPYGTDSKAFDEWATANPGKIVLGQDELAAMDAMELRMPAEVREALYGRPLTAEASVFQTIDGVPVKCRPDLWCQGQDEVTDLKTIDDITDIRHHMKGLRYWFQQEWYKRILLAETGKRHSFRFVFAEKKPPYRWKIATANEEVCEQGAAEVRGVLILLRDAIKTGNYQDCSGIHELITWPDCGHYEEDVA